MTWAQITTYGWTCDGCEWTRLDRDDDSAPEGWIHTMDGRDLCPECQP